MSDDALSADAAACVEALKYAAEKLKVAGVAHIHKPNPEFHELADALDRFPPSDADGAVGEARRITRFMVFEAKKTWPLVKVRDLMRQMPENYSVLVVGPEVIAKVEQVIVETMAAKYAGPKFRLTVPHPQVGVLRRRAYAEDDVEELD